MAKVELGQSHFIKRGWQFYSQSINNASNILIRRRLPIDNDIMHPSSRATQLQRLRISNASKDFSELPARDQKWYYDHPAWTASGKVAAGLQLYVSQHVQAQIDAEPEESPPFTPPMPTYPACVACIWPDGTFTSVCKPNLWTADLSSSFCGPREIGVGHYAFEDIPSFMPMARLWGYDHPYQLYPTAPFRFASGIDANHYLTVGISCLIMVNWASWPQTPWDSFRLQPRDNSFPLAGDGYAANVFMPHYGPASISLVPIGGESELYMLYLTHDHPKHTYFHYEGGWGAPPWEFSCRKDDDGVHHVTECSPWIIPILS